MANNTPINYNEPDDSRPLNSAFSYVRNNFAELLKTLQGIIENDFVISGFDIASSSGLDVTFNPGEAIISGYRVEETAQQTLTMTDNTTNYIYYQINLDVNNVVTSQGFVVNTTGSQPSNSILIAEVTTASGAVSSQSDKRQMGFSVNSAIQANSADTADKIEGQKIGEERFQVSGCVRNITIPSQTEELVQLMGLNIPDGKTVILKRARYEFGLSGGTLPAESIKLRVDVGTASSWESSSGMKAEETPEAILYTNDSGSNKSVSLGIKIYNPNTTDQTIAVSGWWCDIAII